MSVFKERSRVHSCSLYASAKGYKKKYLTDVLAIGQGCMNELKRHIKQRVREKVTISWEADKYPSKD